MDSLAVKEGTKCYMHPKRNLLEPLQAFNFLPRLSLGKLEISMSQKFFRGKDPLAALK